MAHQTLRHSALSPPQLSHGTVLAHRMQVPGPHCLWGSSYFLTMVPQGCASFSPLRRSWLPFPLSTSPGLPSTRLSAGHTVKGSAVDVSPHGWPHGRLRAARGRVLHGLVPFHRWVNGGSENRAAAPATSDAQSWNSAPALSPWTSCLSACVSGWAVTGQPFSCGLGQPPGRFSMKLKEALCDFNNKNENNKMVFLRINCSGIFQMFTKVEKHKLLQTMARLKQSWSCFIRALHPVALPCSGISWSKS